MKNSFALQIVCLMNAAAMIHKLLHSAGKRAPHRHIAGRAFATQLVCGDRHCAVITDEGRVMSWGCAERGRPVAANAAARQQKYDEALTLPVLPGSAREMKSSHSAALNGASPCLHIRSFIRSTSRYSRVMMGTMTRQPRMASASALPTSVSFP